MKRDYIYILIIVILVTIFGMQIKGKLGELEQKNKELAQLTTKKSEQDAVIENLLKYQEKYRRLMEVEKFLWKYVKYDVGEPENWDLRVEGKVLLGVKFRIVTELNAPEQLVEDIVKIELEKHRDSTIQVGDKISLVNALTFEVYNLPSKTTGKNKIPGVDNPDYIYTWRRGEELYLEKTPE